MSAQTTPVDFFSPSASKAFFIDQSVRASLNQSLTWFQPLGVFRYGGLDSAK